MCDSCAKFFDDKLMRDTTILRTLLIKEEKQIIAYMKKICSWLVDEGESKFRNHNCDSAKLRVLGVAKAKKLGITKTGAKKMGIAKTRSTKSNKTVSHPISMPQLVFTPEDENTTKTAIEPSNTTETTDVYSMD
jgi:hypothetical protein